MCLIIGKCKTKKQVYFEKFKNMCVNFLNFKDLRINLLKDRGSTIYQTPKPTIEYWTTNLQNWAFVKIEYQEVARIQLFDVKDHLLFWRGWREGYKFIGRNIYEEVQARRWITQIAEHLGKTSWLAHNYDVWCVFARLCRYAKSGLRTNPSLEWKDDVNSVTSCRGKSQTWDPYIDLQPCTPQSEYD